MAKKFYSVKVKEIEKTTEESVVITLAIEDELQEIFSFQQGQHLTLKAIIEDEEVRRSYSLCSSPLDGSWKVAVKQVEGGKFSTFANHQLKRGDSLEVMPPSGRFFIKCQPQRRNSYVAFAAGSGITPIISIIRTHLALEPHSSFKLFYSNRNVGSMMLKEEIEALKNRYLDRFEVFHFLTQERRVIPLLDGRITEEKLDVLFDRIVDSGDVDAYFLCGPEAMIFMIRDYLHRRKVDRSKVHFELFRSTTAVPSSKQAHPQEVLLNGHDCEVTILEGGRSSVFRMHRDNTKLLDAALEQAADLPFACKGGVCCTCRAKLIEGKVDMERNFGLEEDEIAEGYILTCQAIPLTDKVVVDFDV